jgi:hypothetical protein
MELELDALVLFRFALEETGEGIGLGIILGMGGNAETVADTGTLLTGAAFFPFKMDCVSTSLQQQIQNWNGFL